MFVIQFVIRYFYAPLFFLGFISASLFLVSGGANKAWLLALLIMAICVTFLTERILPYEQIWNSAKNDRLRDFFHAFVNETSSVMAIALIPVFAAIIPFAGIWPSDWPLWGQLVMAILIADFGITMAHYASHKIEFLWRLHAVHHSVERLYGFNGLMKHPVHQAIETLAGTTPLILMGLPIEIGILLAFAIAIQLLLQHSNADMKIGPLIYLWAVAPGHRHHHIASKTRGDVNFGIFTMIWDHMLGTFVHKRPSPRDGELGIAGAPDYPHEYWKQMIEPFRR